MAETNPREGAGETRRQSPWTSLEAAKLVVSALTPVAQFALGLVATQQSEKANQDRDRISRQEAVKRDDALRKAAETREDTLRVEQDRKDRQLRAEANAQSVREKLLQADLDRKLRDEAFAREQSAKEQGLRLASREQILNKRVQMLTALADHVQDIRQLAAKPSFDDDRIRAIKDGLEKGRSKLLTFRPFISAESFGAIDEDVQASIDRAEIALVSREIDPGPERLERARDLLSRSVDDLFETVQRVGSAEVAKATDPEFLLPKAPQR